MKRIFQILQSLIKNLRWQAVRVFLIHPHFIVPTVWATIESIRLSERHFDDSPDGNGPANAYRHAAWNVLIAYYCSKISNSQKAVRWAEKITNLHEELFPNSDFDREMDLHNNSIGRKLYLNAVTDKVKSKKEILQRLKLMTNTAVGLDDEKLFTANLGRLVYFKN